MIFRFLSATDKRRTGLSCIIAVIFNVSIKVNKGNKYETKKMQKNVIVLRWYVLPLYLNHNYNNYDISYTVKKTAIIVKPQYPHHISVNACFPVCSP